MISARPLVIDAELVWAAPLFSDKIKAKFRILHEEGKITWDWKLRDTRGKELAIPTVKAVPFLGCNILFGKEMPNGETNDHRNMDLRLHYINLNTKEMYRACWAGTKFIKGTGKRAKSAKRQKKSVYLDPETKEIVKYSDLVIGANCLYPVKFDTKKLTNLKQMVKMLKEG